MYYPVESHRLGHTLALRTDVTDWPQPCADLHRSVLLPEYSVILRMARKPSSGRTVSQRADHTVVIT
ncbi:hypothetical protein jaqu_24690 [Jannaschia aquimarina]|uniref:Uncharacterized protein n=1 Tax=Jannaschia aquimarina TaxID=935700 RepID=A0A0D1EFZ2_9RHOB|nr:hypothetical protein jaqu_24690 [Jannaschia aquimarina]SNT42956.1 hypothetical protein SAMN05421775_12117 [Jannaschia aquimarina]